MRLAGIDTLRGVAVTSVVLYHFYVLLDLSTLPSFKYIHALGQLGVSLFFIISGYLIYRSIEQAITQQGIKTGIKHYTIHRLLRILPAYYFNLMIVIILAYFIFNAIEGWSVNFIVKQILSHLTFTSFFLYKDAGFEINGAYWTLSIEMLWYILAPFLFLYIKTNKTLFILFVFSFIYLVCIDFGLLTWLFHLNQHDSSYLTLLYFYSFQLPGQLFYFISGILIYKTIKHSITFHYLIYYIIVPIILLVFIYLSNQTFYYASFTLQNLFILFTVSSLFILFHQYHVRNLVVLAWIGEISYSLYLWHMPLLYSIKKYLLPSEYPWWIIISIFILSLFTISSLSYYYIETYGFSLRKKLEKH